MAKVLPRVGSVRGQSSRRPGTAKSARRGGPGLGVILGGVLALAAVGLLGGLLALRHDDPVPFTPPAAVPSGRNYAVREGIEIHNTRPLWELATLAGVPQSCAITRTWTVLETTHGRDPNSTVYLLLCPKRGYWVLNYDRANDVAASTGPLQTVELVEALIDPGGVVTWDGPRPSSLRGAEP